MTFKELATSLFELSSFFFLFSVFPYTLFFCYTLLLLLPLMLNFVISKSNPKCRQNEAQQNLE